MVQDRMFNQYGQDDNDGYLMMMGLDSTGGGANPGMPAATINQLADKHQ